MQTEDRPNKNRINFFSLLILYFAFRINTIGRSATRMEIHSRADAP